MKKTVFILIALLIGLFILLSALTPGGEYAAEKKLWKITESFYKSSRDGRELPEPEAEQFISRIRNFIVMFSDSSLVPYAEILMIDVRAAQGNYPGARKEYEKIIQKYAERPEIAEVAMIKIMNSYYTEQILTERERQDAEKGFPVKKKEPLSGFGAAGMMNIMDEVVKNVDFDLMLRTYRRAMNDFPATSTGIQAPFFIARLYYDAGRLEQSAAALNEAVDYYQKFIVRYANTPAELRARELLVSCYMAQGNVSRAIEALGGILNHPSAGSYLTRVKFLEMTGFLNQLASQAGEFERAAAIYQAFIEEYKGAAALIELARQQWAELRQAGN